MTSTLHTVAIEPTRSGYEAVCEDCRWKGQKVTTQQEAEESASTHTVQPERLTRPADVAPTADGARHDPGARVVRPPPADVSDWSKGVALKGRSLQHASAFGVYHLVEASNEAGRVVGWAVWKQDGAAWSEVGAAVDDVAAAALASAHYDAYVAQLPRCVVCDAPFDHGCNGTAACSLECEDAAWDSPDRARYYPDEVEEPLSADEARQNVIDAGGF